MAVMAGAAGGTLGANRTSPELGLQRNRDSFPGETDKIYSARKIFPNNFPRKPRGREWNNLILFVFEGRTLRQRKLVLKGFYFSVADCIKKGAFVSLRP